MQSIIVLFVVVSVTLAKPAAVLTPLATSISSQYHAQDALGQYTYGYTNGHSAKSEIRTADGITRGGYSYIDAEGKLQSIEYIADSVNGFRAVGSNIPAPVNPTLYHLPTPVVDTPEVAEAKAKHLAAVEEAKLRAAQPLFVAQRAPLYPTVFSVRSDLIPTTNIISGTNFVPAFSYSYDIQNGVISQQPLITTYTSQFLVPTGVSGIAEGSSGPVDTSGTAKVRSEHNEAVENQKENVEKQS